MSRRKRPMGTVPDNREAARDRETAAVDEDEGVETPGEAADVEEAARADADPPAAAADRVAELERAAAEANDRFLRTLAEFENYRKRKTSEMEDVRRFANEDLLADLLPIMDNFERALESSDPEQNPQAFAEGIRLIHRQMQDTLRKAGLEPIEAEGQPFDPTVHEAIMQAPPAEGQEPHQVVEELRKGYKLNGRVVRAALVKVTSD